MRTPDEICEASIARFVKRAREKFWRGQAEHGGCLDENVTDTDIEDEVIDQWHYIQSRVYRLRVENQRLHDEITLLKQELESIRVGHEG